MSQENKGNKGNEVKKANEEKEEKATKKRKFEVDDNYSRGYKHNKLDEKYTTKAQVEARLRKVAMMRKGRERKLLQIKNRLGALHKEEERLNKLKAKLVS